SYDVKELEPSSRDETTYVLNEYFIPVDNFETFIPKMKAIYEKYDVNILNVSLRHALKNEESYLSWAREEVFAFVVYYKQGTGKEAKEEVKKWTQEMSAAILSEGGTWYLPYQPHASMEQFKKAYPDHQAYFAVKKELDPNNRFTNKLLDKYNLNVAKPVEEKIKGYRRSEEQTVLTVPEWYLVFNPKEYADYLEAGKNPSDFPLYASIDEYWKLYDRSVMLTKNYPENDEYMTMLQVIGVSMTIEYGFKMLYENTLGKLFSLFSEKIHSTREDVIIEANRAYSDFVYHTAFYEFSFWSWVKKVWASEEEKEGYSSLRKWERTLFFTLEFSFKALYSQLLTQATKATYEEPVKKIYLWVQSTEAINEHKDLKMIKQQGDKYLLAITRWGAFTKTLLTLPSDTMQIESISGNDNIAVSVLMPKEQSLEKAYSHHLYDSTIVTNTHLKREVNLMPVDKVLDYIAACRKNDIEVEHVYDY
ncbi:MAG: D-arabinono-1,4-lactone oxidase, partial [Campylobacterota bacterium]